MMEDIKLRVSLRHLKKRFADGNSVVWSFRITSYDGKSHETDYHNLSVITAAGNNLDSPCALKVSAEHEERKRAKQGLSVDREKRRDAGSAGAYDIPGLYDRKTGRGIHISDLTATYVTMQQSLAPR